MKTNLIITGLLVSLMACHEVATMDHQFKGHRSTTEDITTNGSDTAHLTPLMAPVDTLKQ
ncbi:MAG: hypothetical protein JKY23_06520 [Nitrospinaceae bacterium]|nr:hypothetical protein [Nitrospinaceae bacterium]